MSPGAARTRMPRSSVPRGLPSNTSREEPRYVSVPEVGDVPKSPTMLMPVASRGGGALHALASCKLRDGDGPPRLLPYWGYIDRPLLLPPPWTAPPPLCECPGLRGLSPGPPGKCGVDILPDRDIGPLPGSQTAGCTCCLAASVAGCVQACADTACAARWFAV